MCTRLSRRTLLLLGSVSTLTLLAAPFHEVAAQDDGPEPAHVQFDPDNFIDPTTNTNAYFPLQPGMQWVRAGTTEVGSRVVPHQAISTMTDVVRIIDGIPAVAMLDQFTDSGEVSQVGMDYFALDKGGNVWMMGSYSEDYEGGEYTNVDEAWLGTGSGGETGIQMPASVTMETPRWFIHSPDEEENPTLGEPVSIGETTTVSFGEFRDVIAIREGQEGAIDNEVKYYAPAVGVILNLPQDASLHQDTFELVNLVQLTAEGLAEASQMVLELEAHAREVVPEVFGSSPMGQRMAQ